MPFREIYRYLPLDLNLDNPNFQIIHSPREITLLSFLCQFACSIRNSLSSKDFSNYVRGTCRNETSSTENLDLRLTASLPPGSSSAHLDTRPEVHTKLGVLCPGVSSLTSAPALRHSIASAVDLTGEYSTHDQRGKNNSASCAEIRAWEEGGIEGGRELIPVSKVLCHIKVIAPCNDTIDEHTSIYLPFEAQFRVKNLLLFFNYTWLLLSLITTGEFLVCALKARHVVFNTIVNFSICLDKFLCRWISTRDNGVCSCKKESPWFIAGVVFQLRFFCGGEFAIHAGEAAIHRTSMYWSHPIQKRPSWLQQEASHQLYWYTHSTAGP